MKKEKFIETPQAVVDAVNEDLKWMGIKRTKDEIWFYKKKNGLEYYEDHGCPSAFYVYDRKTDTAKFAFFNTFPPTF